MPVYQAYNKRNKAWVKYKFLKDGIKFTDVKQVRPKVPFKNVMIKGNRPMKKL